jgi:hypothetical protein
MICVIAGSSLPAQASATMVTTHRLRSSVRIDVVFVGSPHGHRESLALILVKLPSASSQEKSNAPAPNHAWIKTVSVGFS